MWLIFVVPTCNYLFDFFDIFTLKTFNSHAVYVGFHLPDTIKNYYIMPFYICIYISFVHLLLNCCKNRHSNIYIYIYIYVYLQAYRYSDIYVNLHLPCCVPPSSMEGFFLEKELPNFGERFMGRGTWRD